MKSAVGYVRRELARKVNLRNTPEITFVLDQSIEYGVNMSRLIDEVAKNTKSREDETEDETENDFDEEISEDSDEEDEE